MYSKNKKRIADVEEQNRSEKYVFLFPFDYQIQHKSTQTKKRDVVVLKLFITDRWHLNRY